MAPREWWLPRRRGTGVDLWARPASCAPGLREGSHPRALSLSLFRPRRAFWFTADTAWSENLVRGSSQFPQDYGSRGLDPETLSGWGRAKRRFQKSVISRSSPPSTLVKVFCSGRSEVSSDQMGPWGPGLGVNRSVGSGSVHPSAIFCARLKRSWESCFPAGSPSQNFGGMECPQASLCELTMLRGVIRQDSGA